MEVAIRYFSRSGNTKKLAEAIGKELGILPETVDVPLERDVDVLFLGSSVYAYGVDEKVRRFIEENTHRIGIVYNFSTAAIVKSTYSYVKKLLQTQGIILADNEFYCRGEFGPLHRGKPGDRDIKQVRTFAAKALESCDKQQDRKTEI